MKINWLIPFEERDFDRVPASVWIRCLQLIPLFEARGIECVINDRTNRADIAIFIRWQNEDARQIALEQKQRGSKIVFDMVVNYFDASQVEGQNYGVRQQQVEECRRMIDIADAVTCASSYITRRAAQVHPLAVYLSDSINPRHFACIKAPQDFDRPRLRAIWSGTRAKMPELEPVLPVLRRHNMDLVMISDEAVSLHYPGWLRRRAPYTFHRWTYATFPQTILEGEIALSYRQLNTPYNLGHSLFKIGVFMTEGVPALAVPQESYQEIVQPGQNGWLCSTLEAWDAALTTINANRAALRQQSQAARDAIAPYYTDAIVDKYIELFNRLMD